MVEPELPPATDPPDEQPGPAGNRWLIAYLLVILVIATLVVFSPVLSAVLAETAASGLGCPLWQHGFGSPDPPCLVLGIDLIGVLDEMSGCGIMMILAFPPVIALGWIWFAVGVIAVGWFVTRRIIARRRSPPIRTTAR